jgi:hypothetical protein
VVWHHTTGRAQPSYATHGGIAVDVVVEPQPLRVRWLSRAAMLWLMLTVLSFRSWINSAPSGPLHAPSACPPAIVATPRSMSPRKHASRCVMNAPLEYPVANRRAASTHHVASTSATIASQYATSTPFAFVSQQSAAARPRTRIAFAPLSPSSGTLLVSRFGDALQPCC